jgi:glyoxylase-like metal-dependent hydrolase (beta-lactamase superfamily II)
MRSILLGTCVLAALLAAAPGQGQARTDAPGSWLTATRVADQVWRIDDHGGDNMYLVEGKSRALLIDTGLGVAKLADFVRTLTALPVVVVDTHGHPDHAGGNDQFKTVYAPALDFDAIRAVGTTEARRQRLERTTKAAPGAGGLLSADESARLTAAELVPVEDGHVFDLGGRKLEVIAQAGHTPGEIVLVDAANRLLFAGDNDNTLVWLFLPNSRPLEVYLQSLRELKARDAEFDTILPGHGTPLPKTFLAEQIACVESILDGSCKDEPYQSFAGSARVCRKGSAAVAFDPANLRVKK